MLAVSGRMLVAVLGWRLVAAELKIAAPCSNRLLGRLLQNKLIPQNTAKEKAS